VSGVGQGPPATQGQPARQAEQCEKLTCKQAKPLAIAEEKTKVQKGGKGTFRAEGKVDPAKK
jgi:hypothetical protein